MYPLHSSGSCRLNEIMEEPPRKNCRSRTRTNQTWKSCLMFHIQRRDSPVILQHYYELYACLKLSQQTDCLLLKSACFSAKILTRRCFANRTFPNIVNAYMFVQAIDTISVFSHCFSKEGSQIDNVMMMVWRKPSTKRRQWWEMGGSLPVLHPLGKRWAGDAENLHPAYPQSTHWAFHTCIVGRAVGSQ